MVELIHGKIFKMYPSPNRIHQQISGNFFCLIANYLRSKKCKIYYRPFDVRLPLPLENQTPDKIDTIVQPDICVVCDLAKLDVQGCKGAPDWIIEILSPATLKKDLTDKYQLYENAGVQEYWIVSPNDSTVIPYRLDENGKYQLLRNIPFYKGEQIPSGIFSDFTVDLDRVFS